MPLVCSPVEARKFILQPAQPEVQKRAKYENRKPIFTCTECKFLEIQYGRKKKSNDPFTVFSTFNMDNLGKIRELC